MKTVPSWTLGLCLAAPVAPQPPGGGVVVLPVDGTEDLTGRGHAFIELTAPRDSYFVQEPIRLRLRFGVDGQFLKTRMVQLFPRQLDVPVQVQAPWLEKLPETHREDDAAAKRQSYALGESVAAAAAEECTIAGRQFEVLETERSHLPDGPGKLVVLAPILRFAYATRFREDFVQGRMPEDRRDALVRGNQLALEVQPLPARGRPPEFTGAVGRFSITAGVHPPEIVLGESFKLVLSIEGSGNLRSFAPPRLDHLEGFHVLGKVDDKSATRRTVTYDVAPLSLAPKEVPPIRFAFFDPGPPPGYRTVETAPLPITVRPLPEGPWPRLLEKDEADSALPGVNDIFDIKPGTSQSEPPIRPSLWWVLLLCPWVLSLVWWWLRGRAPNLRRLDLNRVRDAAADFRRGSDVPEAFTGFLAALLGCSAAAVIAPDLAQRLEARGIPAELAARAAALLEELFAARYGGRASSDGQDAARTLVDEMEARS